MLPIKVMHSFHMIILSVCLEDFVENYFFL